MGQGPPPAASWAGGGHRGKGRVTTRAATTSRVVANLCFTRFSLSAARRTLDRHEPNLRGLEVRYSTSAPRKRVTGFKGPAASPSSRCQNQAAATRSR